MVREGYYSEQIRNKAFESVLEELGKKQRMVYKVIAENEPCSNEDIAEGLHIPLHTVTPRVLELRQLELVEYAGESVSRRSNRAVSLWRVKAQGKQLDLFGGVITKCDAPPDAWVE